MEQCMLKHLAVKYLHSKPTGLILLQLNYEKYRNGWQLCDVGLIDKFQIVDNIFGMKNM